MQNGSKRDTLGEILQFLSEYSSTLLGSGAYTSRVIRSAGRMADALGVDLEMITSHSSLILSVEDRRTRRFMTKIVTAPKNPIGFELNADLCALSWKAVDEGLTLPQIRKFYAQIISKPRTDPIFVLFVVGLANASFCRLFGGDCVAMAIVFSSTLAGFAAKEYLLKRGANQYLAFIASAFLASVCASSSLAFDCTSEIAVATSPLFLIPGVPLINGVIDILDGYTMSGMTRLIKAAILVVCIATGLSLTLLIAKGALL